MSVRRIEEIEQAIRRTHRSTLDRIALGLVELHPDMGNAETIAERLAGLSGPGLAPESVYRDRVEKRRKDRWRRFERHVLYRHVLPMLHAQLDAKLREERRGERDAQRRTATRR